MESCSEGDITAFRSGRVPRRRSPVPRVIDLEEDRVAKLVIVIGAHDNTSGVSVLPARPFCGGGCRPRAGDRAAAGVAEDV